MSDLEPEVTTAQESAWAAWRAGCCTIPIKDDGSKRPPILWDDYKSRRPTETEMTEWFGPHRAAAVICGRVSGGLVMLEMEGPDYEAGAWQRFRAAVIAELGEDRWRQITACVEMSPSGGPHLLIRCTETTVGNLKLARRRVGPKGVETIMETRGEGGYTVIAGSVGHSTGRRWSMAQGSYAEIATVTAEELHTILDAARTLDEMPAPPIRLSTTTSERPRLHGDSIFDAVVDDYNRHTTWDQVLAGVFEYAFQKGQVTYWHRIGSDNEVGATTNATGRDTLIVFSSSTLFDHYDGAGQAPSYDRFGAMAVLECGGDRTEAYRSARADGFGPSMDDLRATTPPAAATIPLDGPAEEPDAKEPAEDVDPNRVAVYWTDEVAADPPAPLTELVTNLVAVGEVTVFGAPRAMGKTWATMGLAAACAKGTGTMFGSEVLRVTQPTRVVYLQGELGLAASHVRWNLATGGAVPRIAEVFERLRVKTTTRRITQSADGVTWTDEESMAIIDHRLEPMLAEMGCELLVIDPWATYYGGNENSNDEVEAAIDAVTQMARRVGCAVWIVHHISAKASHGNLAEPEDLWRGASRLADAVSTRVTMLPHYTPAKARELGLDRFQARTFGDLHVLQRNGPPVPVIHAQLERFQWRHWEPTDPDGGRPVAVHDEDVVRSLRVAGGSISSKRALADRLGVKSLASLDRSLERLRELGVIDIETGARGAHIYRLNEEELPPR